MRGSYVGRVRTRGHDAEDERGDRGEDANVLLVEESQDSVRPLRGRQHIGRLTVEAQRCERGLLAHECLGGVLG